MGHCCGGYVESCIREISYVFTTGVSTIEIARRDGTWEIVQHQGERNSQPSDSVCQKVERWFCEAVKDFEGTY